MNIIIQGAPYNDFTLKVAHDYASWEAIDRVVISTWTTEQISEQDLQSDKIVLVKSEVPSNNGPGNMNLQLVSSREGLKACADGLVMKTRSDQHLYRHSFEKWMSYFQSQQGQNTLRYRDGEQQKSKIYLIGNNKRFPFHPQDHFLWGYKQDLERLLNIPLWEDPAWTWRDAPIDFAQKLRPNIYFGINYYKQFYPEVERFENDPAKYLLDGASSYQEAMDFYTPIKDSIFGVFPRIEMWWAKQKSGYWYSYEKEGEYYAD
jgi:hypothetical protein